MKITRDVVRSFILGQLCDDFKTLEDLCENFCIAFDFVLSQTSPPKGFSHNNSRSLNFLKELLSMVEEGLIIQEIVDGSIPIPSSIGAITTGDNASSEHMNVRVTVYSLL
jgi:hypothetical protein